MKNCSIIVGSLVLVISAGLSAQGADVTRYGLAAGSKMRIEGTASAIHTHWAVESHLIAGYLEAGNNFPTTPGQAVTPGKVDAKVEPFIPVKSLKSVEDNGEHYSDAMDGVMYDHLKAKDAPNPLINYHLTELTLKEAAAGKDAPYKMEAKGQVVVAGVTNVITMPIEVLPMDDKKLKITGSTSLKMTDFKVSPPSPIPGLKTGDDVKLIFTWMLTPKPAASAAAK